MEFIKTFFITVLLGLALSSQAQYGENVLKAFENSYAAEKSGDYKKAVSLLKSIYQENSYEFNLRLGWLTYKSGLFDDSKKYYRKALEILPYSEEARHGLILPLTARGEWNELITVYEQILINNPGSTVTLYRLGMVHYNRKEWSRAIKYFQKVVDLYPFDYDGLLMLAWTNLQLGKSREAKILFNKVLLFSPGDKSALEGLGLLR
jgi:tetratricopeptide (TPR) repeat protein